MDPILDPDAFIVLPISHTSTAGTPTGNYTIQLGSAAGVGGQAFTLSDGAGGGTFAPASVTVPAGLLSATFTYTNAAPGTYMLGVTPSGGAFGSQPTTTVEAIIAGTSPPQFDIAPPTQTTLLNSDTGWYTITLDAPAAVGGQAFNLSDDGGGGILWPSGTITVLAGHTTTRFAYRNASAGTYTLSATPAGGALSGETALTVEAVVESAGGSMSTGIINPDGMIFAEGYLTATANGGTADHVVFGKLQDISVKDTYSLKEVQGPESLGAVAVAASEAKITLTAKFMVIDARQWAMLRGSTIAHAVGPPSVTTVTRGVNDQPKPFTCHFKTPLDGTDVEFKFYGCVAPDLGADIKLHDWVTYDVTINVYGDSTMTPFRFYDMTLPGDETS